MHHNDGCHHLERGDTYVGSVMCNGTLVGNEPKPVDVYHYSEGRRRGQLCIRYGSKPHQYARTTMERVLEDVAVVKKHYGPNVRMLVMKYKREEEEAAHA